MNCIPCHISIALSSCIKTVIVIFSIIIIIYLLVFFDHYFYIVPYVFKDPSRSVMDICGDNVCILGTDHDTLEDTTILQRILGGNIIGPRKKARTVDADVFWSKYPNDYIPDGKEENMPPPAYSEIDESLSAANIGYPNVSHSLLTVDPMDDNDKMPIIPET